MVRTPRFHCWGPKFGPWSGSWGNKILKAARHSQSRGGRVKILLKLISLSYLSGLSTKIIVLAFINLFSLGRVIRVKMGARWKGRQLSLQRKDPTGHRKPGWSQLFQHWKKIPSKTSSLRRANIPPHRPILLLGPRISWPRVSSRREKTQPAITSACLTSTSTCLFLFSVIKNPVCFFFKSLPSLI